jgi:hypothetical protein
VAVVPLSAAPIETPGPSTSGLIRPSTVGPRLEKNARYGPSEA